MNADHDSLLKPASEAAKAKPVVVALALASLFVAILLPPEAYPDGRLAVILSASFAFFVSLAERRIPSAYLWAGLGVFGYLLLHDFLVSADLYRSLEFTSVVWAYYCLAGFFLYAGFEPLVPVALSMVTISMVVSSYGLYQYFFGFDRLYDYVFYSSSDQVVKVPALNLIAERRVSSTLPLPGTLWGFLLIALPCHAALWRSGRRTNIILACSVLLLLATGFLTRSFGFLVGIFVLVAVWLLLRQRRAIWNQLTIALVVLAVAGGVFYSARRGVIESSNPAALRAKNWISAWTMFAANPLGTGLNTYGVVYPQYMLPNANETQYAHNTFLQLLAELGYGFVFAAAGMVLLIRRDNDRQRGRPRSMYLLLALIVWLVHNLIDIDVYFPSVGVVGVVLAAVYFWRGEKRLYATAVAPKAAVALLGAVLVTFAALVMVSTELQHRAQTEFEQKKFDAATQSLKQAISIMPLNASLFHDYGDVLLNLYHTRHDPAFLTAATASFKHATSLSPLKAGHYTGLSLCLSSANRIDEALAEIRTAQRLAPDSTYIESIRKMFEKRREEAYEPRAGN